MDGHGTCCDIDDATRDEVRRHTIEATFDAAHLLGRDRIEPADARRDQATAARCVLCIHVQGALVECLLSSDEGELGEALLSARFRLVDPCVHVQIAYLAGKLHLHVGGVVARDGSDAAYAVARRRPGRCRVVA